MDTAIIVAIVALVSTIVGAAIGATTNYLLAARSERADRERDSLNHAIEVKRAARLLDLELGKAQALADISIGKRCWVADVVLSTEAWQKYGGTIAPDLSHPAWSAITTAFMAVEHIAGARAQYEGSPLRDNAISDRYAQGIAPMRRDVLLGREALAPFVCDALPGREVLGALVDQAPTLVKAYTDMKQHADYVTAEERRLTAEVTEATALQSDASAQKVLGESRGLMVAVSLFRDHVDSLIFPSQPLSPEITEKTLMDVRFGVVEAYKQVNAEVARRLKSIE